MLFGLTMENDDLARRSMATLETEDILLKLKFHVTLISCNICLGNLAMVTIVLFHFRFLFILQLNIGEKYSQT